MRVAKTGIVIKVDVSTSIDFYVVRFDITALDLHVPRLARRGDNHFTVTKPVPCSWTPLNGLVHNLLITYVDGNRILRVAPVRPVSSTDMCLNHILDTKNDCTGMLV